jgi:hypothetical protein
MNIMPVWLREAFQAPSKRRAASVITDQRASELEVSYAGEFRVRAAFR